MERDTAAFWSRQTAIMVAVGVLPSLWAAWLLWLAPIEGLAADRSALAARDFTALWAAGHAAANDTLAVLGQPESFTAYLRTMFGPGIPPQIWPYPPPILLLARPLAAFGLQTGFVVYFVLGLALLALALWLGRLPLATIVAVLLSPAVAANALTGQNGTIVAALLAGGLLMVDRRPSLSGATLGLLAIKPQFALLLPVCLIAGARWRTIVFGCISAVTLALSSVLAFGHKPWVAFLASNHTSIPAYIEAPWQASPSQSIFCSVFMAARSIGAGLPAAYAAQFAVSCLCAWQAWVVWRLPGVTSQRRALATIPLGLLAAPWVHTYDMPALAIGVALLLPASSGATRLLLLVAWLLPGLSSIVPIPPTLAVMSIASVAWIGVSWARVGSFDRQPQSSSALA